jgi:hypothetical protein
VNVLRKRVPRQFVCRLFTDPNFPFSQEKCFTMYFLLRLHICRKTNYMPELPILKGRYILTKFNVRGILCEGT